MNSAQRDEQAPAELAGYEIDQDRGFLPLPDPLDRLPEPFALWESAARELPKLLVTGRVRSLLRQIPMVRAQGLADDREKRRAMVLLSFLGHAYVWGEEAPAARLPAAIAVPWWELAQQLGRPPVLSYASYVLDNWKRLASDGPLDLGNIALAQNFLGGLDEEWFVLVHVAIEARGGRALAAMLRAQRAVQSGASPELEKELLSIAAALETMLDTLLRMPEHCDPYIYYHRVRPYLHGWCHHPALPDGLIYEGVEAYGGRGQKFRGETGAQSALVPALDAFLGIVHQKDLLRDYLLEMFDYMPPRHRAFIEHLKRGPSVRQFVIDHKPSRTSLRDAYNAAVDGLARFRTAHLEYARNYIDKQGRRGGCNPADVGTGGTPFIPYLTKHRDETGRQRIR